MVVAVIKTACMYDRVNIRCVIILTVSSVWEHSDII